MEIGVRILLAFLLHQGTGCSMAAVQTPALTSHLGARDTGKVARVGGQEDGGHEGCSPGFQVKHYQLAFTGSFQKGQALIQVEFDDCAGNEDVQFEVSDPSFFVDEDLNLVPRQDVLRSQPVLSIHGLSAHADDTAQVEVTGLPAQSPHTLRCVLGVGQTLPFRSKRSLLIPPMIVTENQRAPFPRKIGTIDLSALPPSVHLHQLISAVTPSYADLPPHLYEDVLHLHKSIPAVTLLTLPPYAHPLLLLTAALNITEIEKGSAVDRIISWTQGRLRQNMAPSAFLL
ncbi:cadherin-4-like [Gasterosteus aculeatus]